MLYRTCKLCGANLDPGEACDCRSIEKEPSRGNVNGSKDSPMGKGPFVSITDMSAVVNSFVEPVRAMRVVNGLTQDECVEMIRVQCPGFDKTLQSKCENSKRYGITYTKPIYDMFYAMLPPETQAIVRHERNGRHNWEKRMQVRLPDNIHERVKAQLDKRGLNTQDFLYYLIMEWLCAVEVDDEAI